jgi:hypothetical protein
MSPVARIKICLVVEPATPLKNDGLKVTWEDDIPNISQYDGKSNPFMFQTTNQK